jgi:hypothetical protein
VGQTRGAGEAGDMIFGMKKRTRRALGRVFMGIFLVVFVISVVAVGLMVLTLQPK